MTVMMDISCGNVKQALPKTWPTETPEPGRGPPPGFAFPGVEDGGFDAQGAQTSGTGQAGHATTCGNKNLAAIN